MSKIVWDVTGEHLYETGVDHGVMYPYDTATSKFTNGVAWNGLTAVNESPSGAEPNALYADNIKYLNLMSNEEYGATVEAYYAPDEFMECDGFDEIAPGVIIGQQNRKIFGLSYRTLIGSDTEGTSKGYKIHCVYNATASPSERSHSTVNENPDATALSWSISTTPVTVTGKKPTSVVEIDSTKCDPTQLAALEEVLYGNNSTNARLPFPDEIAEIVGQAAVTVKLSSLTIGSEQLVPSFNADTLTYTVATSTASEAVSATAAGEASATILVNGSSHTSGQNASWNSGTNTVVVMVSKSGSTSRSYTVTVNYTPAG